jgi:hypothetical protein
MGGEYPWAPVDQMKEIINLANDNGLNTGAGWLRKFFFELDGNSGDGQWRRSDYNKFIDQKFGLHFGMK